MAKLSDRQQRFVEEYVKDLNATAAYMRAGYTATGKAAESGASRLLSNAKVKAAIEIALSRITAKAYATTERLHQELERIALFDPRRMFDAGAMLPPDQWDDDTAAAVAAIETHEQYAGKGSARKLVGFVRKAKTWDKVASILALLKRRDMAGKGELGSKDNPIHHRLSFIEFADVPEAVPGEGNEAGRPDGAALEPQPGPAPRP